MSASRETLCILCKWTSGFNGWNTWSHATKNVYSVTYWFVKNIMASVLAKTKKLQSISDEARSARLPACQMPWSRTRQKLPLTEFHVLLITRGGKVSTGEETKHWFTLNQKDSAYSNSHRRVVSDGSTKQHIYRLLALHTYLTWTQHNYQPYGTLR